MTAPTRPYHFAPAPRQILRSFWVTFWIVVAFCAGGMAYAAIISTGSNCPSVSCGSEPWGAAGSQSSHRSLAVGGYNDFSGKFPRENQ